MNLTEGKNFKLVNKYGIHYDLYNPAVGKEYTIRVYGKHDLLVDGKVEVSPEDYWIVLRDIDGEAFAQPIDASILAEKLMTLGFIPMKERK